MLEGDTVCSNENKSSGSAAWRNLRQPMPLGKKLKLVASNTWIKISHKQTCCGHHGEPGC